jgi:protein-S-isoprenylcysteine O-methyltransferase Ste14
MSKNQWFAVLAIVVIANAGAHMFGLEFKPALLVSLILAWIAIAVLVSRRERQLIADFKVGSTDYRERVLNLLGTDAQPFLHKVQGTFRRDWHWAAVNATTATVLILGLPLSYSIATKANLSWDSSFTGWHLLLMFIGFGLWAAIRRWRARSYRCPSCKTGLSPAANEKLQFQCPQCGILWYVLDRNQWV